ncbi:MAG: hypothetical protein ACK4SN_03330, partial [Bellilinea sp.]
MTNYLMSDDSFMVSSVYKPKLNYRIFLFIRNQQEAQELTDQISAFGYQVNQFAKSDELISALRWSLPNAILAFVDSKTLSFEDYEELAQKLKKQSNPLPLIII